MHAVTILKVGSTVEPLIARRGDFEDWFRAGLGFDAERASVVCPHLGERLPEPASVEAVVVTGSPAMVTDEAPWSVRCEAWLAIVVGRGTPVLGVCYGHQLLARAFGGRVGDNPHGREIGTVTVSLTAAAGSDPLLGRLGPELVVQSTHSQSVVELPAGARLLARNAHDSAQAFAIGERAWGVQFHPEFDADIIRGYAEARASALRRDGLDPEQVRRSARDSDHGVTLLRRFAALLASR